MSIRTADCVKAITEFFDDDRNGFIHNGKNLDKNLMCNVKNWKRISKRGNKVTGFIREFRNTKDITIKVFVKATDDQIVNIHHSTQKLKFACISCGAISVNRPNVTASVPKASGLLAKCKQLMIDANYISTYELLNNLEFTTLPQVECEIYGGNGETELEDIDFENNAIVSLNDSTIRLWAGGDWQDPVTFSATFKNGELYYNNDAIDDNSEKEITTKQLIKIVFGCDNPPELAGKQIANY